MTRCARYFKPASGQLAGQIRQAHIHAVVDAGVGIVEFLVAVCDAVFREFGAYRAQDTDELLDVAYAASFGVLPADERIGLITVSGGMGIQMADAAERCGLPLEPMPADTQERLRKRLPFASPRNPVDITAQVFVDFARWIKVPVPDGCAHLARWHAEVSARPSASL